MFETLRARRNLFFACCLPSLLCLDFVGDPAPAVADEARFTAELADGNRISGSDVAGWADEKQNPTLGGRAVFDAKNPFRWMINHSLSPAKPPEAFVEFFGGDRLPGEVVGFQTGRESNYLDLPKHLIIDPLVPLYSPRISGNLQVRVKTQWLKRVVWQPRTLDLYNPGHIYFKDGRELRFRSLRWANNSITLLLDDGIQEVFFDDLLEIHFPQPDVWAAYFEQMAVLSPKSSLANGTPARIMQMETSDGLKATVSTERLQPFVHGNRNKSESWHHLCQPAWCLDPFWVRFDSVWSRRFYWPHQPPLTAIEPAGVKQNSPLGDSWYWRLDRNVYRQPLKAAGKDFGWGFGVHAFHEMAFPLTPSARAFRVKAGLDQSVGEGGSVRWQVSLRGADEKSLYQSPIVKGTNQVLDTNRLAISALSEGEPTRELVLTVDPLLSGAPVGSDPLDIRDSLNWLEPEIELDPKLLQRELAKHSLTQIAALADWTSETDPAESLALDNVWEEFDQNDPRYRTLLGSQGRFLSLTKTLKIGDRDRWLVLAVNRPSEKAPPVSLQVHLDGAAVAELEIPPARDALGPDPLSIPVDAYRGRTVNVRLVQFPTPAANQKNEDLATGVEWRGIATSSHRPGLLPLLKENAAFLAEFSEGEGTLELVGDEHFSGTKSVKVTPGERGRSQLPNLEAPIRSLPRLGEYRYISFAWKKSGGQEIALGLAHHGKFGGDGFGNGRPRVRRDPSQFKRPKVRARREMESVGRGLPYGYRYLRGRSNPEIGSAMMLDRKIPDDWQRIERDVFSDFGEFTLTGLSLIAFDGEAAWFDEIYLARTRQDLEQLPSRRREQPPLSDPNILKAESQKDRYGRASVGVLGPFAISQAGDWVRLLKDYQGKQNVLRTIPKDQNTPCILRAPIVLPQNQKARLELEVNRHAEGDWKLLVFANGEKLSETLITKDNSDEKKWHQVSVDLSKFAGQPVMLEIQNAANNWQNEDAYWSRVGIVH